MYCLITRNGVLFEFTVDANPFVLSIKFPFMFPAVNIDKSFEVTDTLESTIIDYLYPLVFKSEYCHPREVAIESIFG